MRIFIVLVVLAVLGWLFLAQKQQEHQKVLTAQAPTQTASPRPVSEHNWMKRSLDRASEVKQQVAQQRKEDGTK